MAPFGIVPLLSFLILTLAGLRLLVRLRRRQLAQLASPRVVPPQG